MQFKFVDYKSDSTYIPLLAKIAFRYCNNNYFDGTIYTTFSMGDTNNNPVETLINELTPLPLIINKKNAIILNLLVEPFFDDLCVYLSQNNKISRGKIKLIKKHIFSYLSDEYTKQLYSDLVVEGASIYINKNMYERSKKMLEEL